MTYSSYQQAIFNWALTGKGNAIVNAVAGSGKTTTAIAAMEYMKGKGVSLAFNKKIAVALQGKILERGFIHFEGSTIHALCLRVYKKGTKGYINVTSSKVWSIVERYCYEDEMASAKNFICKLVGFAKQYGIGLSGVAEIDDTEAWMKIVSTQDLPMDMDMEVEDAIEIAKKVLRDSNRERKDIDFDDMIYLPLFYNMTFPTYDWVIVDEAQDTNVVRKLVLEKCMGPNSRLLAIGDRAQAIYGFAGAENNSMELIKEMFNCCELPLSTCYRCGKSIIVEAQKYSQDIQAYEGNMEGIVRHEKYHDFLGAATGYGFSRKDGIICRNNAPLVSLAFGLIRQGIGCRIEGRDIGKNLITLCNKWKKVKDLNTFMEKLITYFDKEMDKAKGKTKLQLLEDKLETMIILIERCQSLGQTKVQSLIDLIDTMFSDSDERGIPDIVTLSSVHKAKGLEWKRCFLLGKDQFMPSKYAITPDAKEQEQNLIYVAVTRAMEELVFIDDVPTRSNKPSEG